MATESPQMAMHCHLSVQLHCRMQMQMHWRCAPSLPDRMVPPVGFEPTLGPF
jgi:hypothetical protein